MLDEANQLIGETTGLLQSMSNSRRLEKTQRFINQTRERVSQLETKLETVMNKYNITGEDREAIRQRFQELGVSLDNLSRAIERDDLKDISKRLQSVVKDSRRVGKDNDDLDDELLEILNDITDRESKINHYRIRLEALSQQGVNTTELEDHLNQASSLLADAQTSIESDDYESAEDFIDEADEIIDKVDDSIDDKEELIEEQDETRRELEEERELLEEINELRAKLREYRGEQEGNTTRYETRLDQLEQALDEAESEEDLKDIEDLLDTLDDEIEDLDESLSESEHRREDHDEEDENNQELPEDDDEDSTD